MKYRTMEDFEIMPEELTIDTPELEQVEAEQPEAVEAVDEPVAEPVIEAKAEDDVDWRKVPAEYRELLKNPANKRLLDAWHERRAFREHFPDGTKQAEAMLSFLTEKGGQESLSTTLSELESARTDLEALQQMATQGDKALVDRLAESPDGFRKLAPAMMQKYAQVDPEGWTRDLSSVMASTMENAGIPLFLERMTMMLKYGETENAMASLKQLGDWVGGLKANRGTSQTTQSAPVDAREQQLNDREMQMFRTETGREVESARMPVIEAELKTFFDRRPKDTDARDLAVANVRRQVIERLAKDADFQKNLNNLEARRDKAGILRLIASKEKTAIQDIAPKVGRAVFGQPAAAKPPVAAETKPKPKVTSITEEMDPKKKFLREMLSA